jgi:signal recognition particle receptor subunit beta
VLFLRHVDALKLMWNSVAMKKAWVNRAEANVIDGHKVYLDDMDRIASETFRPTQNDVLLARVRTTAAVKERFKIKGATFEVFDIGGQRGERRKWWEVFDQEMDAVIFVAALSEYDQTLTEARRSNRMIEALELFKSVINNQHFAETPIILFLNKKDIFAEKIQYSHIAAQPPFADYIGPRCDFNAGIEYFSTKFKDCIMDDEMQKNYIETTCATDTNQMDFVLDSTRQIILEYNLKFSGF